MCVQHLWSAQTDRHTYIHTAILAPLFLYISRPACNDGNAFFAPVSARARPFAFALGHIKVIPCRRQGMAHAFWVAATAPTAARMGIAQLSLSRLVARSLQTNVITFKAIYSSAVYCTTQQYTVSVRIRTTRVRSVHTHETSRGSNANAAQVDAGRAQLFLYYMYVRAYIL